MSYKPEVIENIKKSAVILDEKAYDILLEKIGDAQVVLLGEATHGTHEFYEIRAEITKKLILQKDFNAIAIEGDWPDAYNINNYIHQKKYKNAQEALASFDRFPTWMWRNVSILKLVEWLKNHNTKSNDQVGFYGLDLYSLYRSIDAVILHLEKIDPKLAQEARYKYACLEQYRYDPQVYGYSVFTKLSESCENEVIEVLKKLEELEWRFIKEKREQVDEAFYITQNGRVVKNSESYYRYLFVSEIKNWNLRDSHMMETLEELINYYKKNGISKPKIIVWAHNSHIGNSKFTQMSSTGEYNIGELVKNKFGNNSYSLGFTTYNGTVSAASDWHRPVERKIIRNALSNSYEELFHQVEIPQFLLTLEDKNLVPNELLERAIGVVYAPQTERLSHYFYASLANQFDAIIHCDKTTALEPLEKSSAWIEGETPETYPSGL